MITHEYDQSEISMNMVPQQAMVTIAIVPNKKQVDELEPSLMYSMLFQEILLEIEEDDTQVVRDLVVCCRGKGTHEYQLKQFQDEYEQKSAIWWYNFEIFLYGMLNRALRLFDTETMMKMGVFVRNLHQQLAQLHKEQFSAYVEKFNVCRAQGLRNKEFHHLLDPQGEIHGFNNFLSTSKEWQQPQSLLSAR
ncbi:unnamed protein product [Rotaria socialis]|uniref:Uncharacterized protein n=1 Tax=Rotaria socialis TaxID=392032 RepID=A0A818PAM7_9BILA|nr:unnamed protein product [Rotaria socialis]CAF4697429.1 unnamed protein product [Rotaria socialis]